MKKLSKRFLSLATLFALLLSCMPAIAGGVTAAQPIAKLWITQPGALRVFGTNKWTNKDNCANTSYAVLKSSHAQFNKLYAMLLVSHANGFKTALVVNGCVKDRGKTRPVVTAVIMH